jgi:hypothetical protein
MQANDCVYINDFFKTVYLVAFKLENLKPMKGEKQKFNDLLGLLLKGKADARDEGQDSIRNEVPSRL